MIGPSAAVALHRRKSRSVQSASRGRSTGCKTDSSSRTGTGTRNMTKTAAVLYEKSSELLKGRSIRTHITLLARPLNPQGRALCLDMTNPSARVTLLSSNTARLRASGRFMSGLPAVVAETLLRGTILRNVTHYNQWMRSFSYNDKVSASTHDCHT